MVLPKRLPARSAAIRIAPPLLEAAGIPADDVVRKMQTSMDGLTEEEAEDRLKTHGPNVVAQEHGYVWLRLLGKALINPLVILLLVLAVVSYLTGDLRAAIVMLIMVALGVILRFVQEMRADAAAAALKAMISVTATVLRGGQPREIPLGQLVPGDIVKLAAGDMIPADLRLLSCKDLFVIQSALTGEAFPVEKFDAPERDPENAKLELKNVCFLGTSVESGTALGVLVATGLQTYLGSMSSAMVQQTTETSFDRGIRAFTWLMIRFILVMVPLVFLINGLTKGDWKEAFFFAMAVAVGLTPEMLPMIVTVCLSKGAIAMSRKKVIVKRLNSIQNLGAMDVLCTDKTGTLTMDHIILVKHCDVVLENDPSVLELAFLNSHFQTGLKNLMDRAVLQYAEGNQGEIHQGFRKIDEIPFDFSRKIMSVVVGSQGQPNRIICKGASEEIFRRCTQYELDGKPRPMEQIILEDLREEHDRLSMDGFRVLAVAYRDLKDKPSYSKEDESDLILKGYVAFLDPPKDTSLAAIKALQEHGVAVKVLTGDNDLVSRKICSEVGIDVEHSLLGGQVEKMSDADLAENAGKTTLFARLSPAHKQRIIKALQSKGHVVGFLGDGINDAPALRAADVGISVDTAVDIAKESADAILLEKNLLVLEEGVLEGRKVFANILKYIRMGASSNFGNMFSVLGASIFLPFLPMAPIQILTNNLLYDFSQVPIPTDNVDPEQIAKPRPWSMTQITRFILFIGPCSSIFDYTTFLIMLFVFKCGSEALHCPPQWLEWAKDWAKQLPEGQQDNLNLAYRAALFQTGWFIESLLTQTIIIHIIRTNRIPFLQSSASWPLIVTSVLIMIIGIWLPFSPVGPALGFTHVPPLYWPLVFLTLFCYIVLTQLVKMWLFRRNWI
ncbi:MAG TPA: magnesium-translocating P-type ATPase [Gemmataceae bacterium]|nr:magnesium-translocating P-type ATPase [Gemmataceae bacterium]